MKIFFYIMVLLHILAEGIAGVVLLFSPTMLVADAVGGGLQYTTLYGSAGITMAALVGWLWPYRRSVEVLTVALGTFATFHTLVALGGAVAGVEGGMGILAMHGIFAICFWILWAKRQSLAAS